MPLIKKGIDPRDATANNSHVFVGETFYGSGSFEKRVGENRYIGVSRYFGFDGQTGILTLSKGYFDFVKQRGFQTTFHEYNEGASFYMTFNITYETENPITTCGCVVLPPLTNWVSISFVGIWNYNEESEEYSLTIPNWTPTETTGGSTISWGRV